MKKNAHTNNGFFDGEGEMGELTRNFDWEKTQLGKIEDWPLSLKTIVGTLLHSAFPMFLFWGEDLLCFYNDAYRPSLGIDGKHPALGKKAREVWPDIWDFIGPLIEKVMATGKAVWFEDQLLPIYRNGKMEDVYWTFSYSPAYGDLGQIEGVFVTCTETTGKVFAQREMQENADKFRALVEEAPVGTCLFTGREMKVEIINDIMVGYWGKGHTVLGKPLVDALPELRDQPFLKLLDDVYTSGKPYIAKGALVELEMDGVKKEFYYDFTYKPVRNSSGDVFGIINVSIDATERVIAQRKVENSQKELLAYFEQSPVAIATIDKVNLTFRMANPFYGELVGRDPAEIINKPLLEALPELKGQGFDNLLNDVIATGTAFIAPEVSVVIKRKGVLETIYVDLTYQPQRDYQDQIIGVLVVATDVTEQVLARKTVAASKQQLEFAIDAAELGTWELNPVTNTFKGNTRLKEWFGLKPDDEIPLPLALAVISEKDRDKVTAAINRALTFESGGYYDVEYTILNPATGKEIIVKAKGKAYFDEQKQPYTFSGTLQDVTEEASVRTHLKLLNDTVPAMIFYLDAEQRYSSYNSVFMEWFNVNATDALGKTTREFIGEAAYQKAAPHLAKAYAGQQVQYEMHAPLKIGGEKWLSIVYTPHKNSEGKVIGLIVHATDITQSKQTEKSLRDSELFSRDVFYSSPIAKIVFTGMDMTIARVNENMLNILGRDESIVGMSFAKALPELLNTPLLERMRDVYKTGKIFEMPEERLTLIRHGKEHTGFYSYIYKPLTSATGEIYGVMGTANEVTDQVTARQLVEAKEKELRELISAAPIGIAVLTGREARFTEVNEQFILISGKKPGQFVNATYWEVFPEVAEAFAPVLNNVFETGIKFNSAETELVLIRNGVPETMYATFEYIPFKDANNKVTKIIVIVVEVTHQVETRKEIEDAVVKRTKELAESNLNLKRSNEELEQFAYIASHDLQEPIRKISTFMQMLEHSMKDPSEKSKDYISKIYNSADRMTNLVRDVLAFSRIKGNTEVFEKVDLKKTFEAVRTDFELQIEETHATIETSGLPTINAIPSQMTQLFSNLVSNSLKYRKADVKPEIKISASIAKDEKVAKRLVLDPKKKYYHIQFSDNGIGFSKEHVDRIFKIFQRLHGKTEFEGTGIGLAICLKIVQNHHGHISAAVGENGGAVFNILLPQMHEELENDAV